MLYLLGNAWFKTISSGRPPLSHMVGLALCLAAFFAGPGLSLLWQQLAMVAVLGLVAVWEQVSLRRGPGPGLA